MAPSRVCQVARIAPHLNALMFGIIRERVYKIKLVRVFSGLANRRAPRLLLSAAGCALAMASAYGLVTGR